MLPISRLTEDIGELVAGLAHHKVYKVERSRFSDGTRPLILIDHLEYKVGTLVVQTLFYLMYVAKFDIT